MEFWSVPDVKDLSETLEENDRGMLTELLRCLDQDENFDHCEVEEQVRFQLYPFTWFSNATLLMSFFATLFPQTSVKGRWGVFFF